MGVPRSGGGLSASLMMSLTLTLMPVAPDVVQAQTQPTAGSAGVYWVYVGTYTNGQGRDRSRGIYLMELDIRTGGLDAPRLAAVSSDPSFLAIHPSREFLFSVNESGEIQGRRDGGVSAFAIDQGKGTLTLLNQQLSAGSGPCHLVVDRQGQNVLVANYGSGSVGCLPIERDGRLRPASSKIQHRGRGADPRAAGSSRTRTRSISTRRTDTPFVADLGLDKVLVYAFDPARGHLTPHQPPFAKVAPASGPRHFAFHPEGRFAYVINEMANTVTAFAYDADPGHSPRSRRSRPCPPTSAGGATPPRSRCTPPASSSTGRTAGTTASRSSPSTRRPAS